MNNKEEIKEFQNYLVAEAKSLNKDPKKYVLELGEDGLKAAYERFQNHKKKKAQKALHGAKLNYFKSLKNQCAEDEEVVYYREGGSVECGCKKKEGGEVGTAKSDSPVDKFKAKKFSSGGKPKKKELNIKWTNLDDRKLDSLVTRSEIKKKPLTPQGQKDLKALREKFKNSSNKEQYEVEASEQKKCGGKVKVKKECGGSKVIANFKAKCGTKMKKHQQGGSLNGIPFFKKEK